MRILFTVLGALLGAAVGDEGGLIGGAILGYVIGQMMRYENRIRDLTKKVDELAEKVTSMSIVGHEPIAAAGMVDTADTQATPYRSPAVSEPTGATEIIDEPAITQPAFSEPATAESAEDVFQPSWKPGDFSQSRPPVTKPEERKPAFDPGVWLEPVRQFLFGGNTLARVGILILFVGLSFLVKYAADNDYLPLELRLSGAALMGIALTVTGWNLRFKRSDFSLILQGGGIAIIYLTVFASYRLYQLIPSGATFGILVALTLFGTILAILQNAQSLAVLSVLGGFFAPVLASTGEGSHVTLFSYYVLINLGILVIARFKTWRPLNLVGFLCTFGIGVAWGGLKYDSALFASTEPFLIAFFLIYFTISWLHANRRGPDERFAVDGTLVFGLPVVVFSIQSVLVDPFPYGLAVSSLVLGLFYTAVAWIIYRRSPGTIRLLVESYTGIGLALVTMVIPFALDATWTATGWALEGAALVWLGLRQGRFLVRWSGFLLQLAAAFSYLLGIDQGTTLPVLNPLFVGALTLSLSAGFTAFQLERWAERMDPREIPLTYFFLAVSVLWWITGGLSEIERSVVSLYVLPVGLTFVVLSGLLSVGLSKLFRWSGMTIPPRFVLPALFVYAFVMFADLPHVFARGGVLAWILALAAHYYILKKLEDSSPALLVEWWHSAGVWLISFLLIDELFWVLGLKLPSTSVWPQLAIGIVTAAITLLVIRGERLLSWPLRTYRTAYLVRGLLPAMVIGWLWSLVVTFVSNGNPAPLPYIPILNPLDLILGFGALAGISWFVAVRNETRFLSGDSYRSVALWVLCSTLFLWLSADVARTVHFWSGVPYTDTALFDSVLFQASLTIFWSILGVTFMVIAAKKGLRAVWFVAAGLMAVVVGKLFLIDLSNISTVARIITFIVVGLLLLLVGYIAPVPPKKQEPIEIQQTPA